MNNYPWEPHKTVVSGYDSYITLYRGVDTLQEAERLAVDYIYYSIDNKLFSQINDIAYLAIYSGLRQTTNRDTWGLANDRIPTNNTLDKTLRFLIALLYEKQNDINKLIENVKSEITFNPSSNKYQLRSSRTVYNTIVKWSKRCDKIVDIMDSARSAVGNAAASANFIRNWALVDLGEETGIELVTANNPIQFGYQIGVDLTLFRLTERNSAKMIKLDSLSQPDSFIYSGITDTVTATAKNGPSELRIKTGTNTWGSPFVLAKDASKTFTREELRYEVESTPILLPVASRELSDIASINIGVTESVDLQNLFEGLRINITAASASETIARVQVNNTQTSMGVVAVSNGTTTITVTGTNEAGSTSISFDVTVTEGTRE